MRVVIAPDSFKECRTAPEVCAAIRRGVLRADPDAQIVLVPMADGGEGTVDALVRATGGRQEKVVVRGPLGEPVEAAFGLLGDGATAVIEMAAASGLALVPPRERNPLVTSTYGTGQLVRAALDAGTRRLVIGIGGSATNDGGAGMAQSLGYRLLDAQGAEIGPGGSSLGHLDRIDRAGRDPRLGQATIEVACDVTNPLTGPEGASAVYGPQKGATAQMVQQLDRNLGRLADIVRRDLGVEIEGIPGAGAAGGMGGGLVAFCGATLRRGVELVIDTVDLAGKLAGADLCLTGEGAIDQSSRFGKTAVGVAALGQRLGVPVVALCGAVLPGARGTLESGLVAYFDCTTKPSSLEAALAATTESLEELAEQVTRLFLAAQGRHARPT